MLCPRCQRTVDPGAAFCGNCGFQLMQPQTQPLVAPETRQPVTQEYTPPPEAVTPQVAPVPLPPPQPFQPIQPIQTAVPPVPTPQPEVPQAPFQPTYPGGLPPLQPSPNYAAPPVHDHSGKAIASFVLGVLGLPASLIPIVGIVFGVLAIVFGTLSIHSAKRVFAIVGMSFAVLVLLASTFFWVHTAQELVKQHKNGFPTSSDNGSLQSVTTPCYSTKVPAAMKITQTSGSCTFLASNAGTGEQEEVKVMQVPQLTLANLPTAAKADAANVVGSIPGGSIAGQHASTFVESQAYEVRIKSTDGSAGTISYVYNTTAQGNLVIVLHTQARASDNNYDLSSIEANWAWL